MRVDLIRHGATKGNREKRYVGVTDEPLTEEARACAGKMRLDMPDLLFVSPMKRCVETAALLYPGKEMVIIPELAECNFGRFEYMNWQELSGDPDYQAWIDSGGIIGFPGGEDRETFISRCTAGFYEAEKKASVKQAEHIAFVVHGGTIMAILADIGRPKRDYFDWQSGNLSGFTAEYADGYLRCPRKYGKIRE